MNERTKETMRVVDPAAGEPLLEGVAIIGMAGQFPGAPDVEAFWENVVAGKVSISRFAPSELEARNSAGIESGSDYVPARGVLEEPGMFDAEFFGVSPRDAASMDPQHRIFLEQATISRPTPGKLVWLADAASILIFWRTCATTGHSSMR
jgi:hypothetical protein